ncbi:glycine/D-amino acid oxidase, deaminating [Pseudomonas sp. GM33]|uniref:NAD(P)/FAD-dependent oxidoreductase n=1 Tax=Pseudomonas sp. GM33 TaxID=1144329 RepID=UPI00026FE9AB|nr:FAD-dependent oxidoreductase [Pseudomonas sp. GM33]EJM34462.1 glycine/D-amino acid oxidase, deaminating [Pseudomonas sp. GM33]
MNKTSIDTLVIGGGVVGMSIAYGLALAGERVRVLDEGDDAFRAARGNFGLVWVQGKGVSSPNYARWTMHSAKGWQAFAQDLTDRTGISLELEQNGGLHFCLSEQELEQRVASMESLRLALGEPYPYEVLDHAALRALEPHIGPKVVGATFSNLDGHVSPLRLLRALFAAFRALGGELINPARCERIQKLSDGFHVWAAGVEHVAGRIVLTAGLGNRHLAPMVGIDAPIEPNRGQILVTERMKPFLKFPSGVIRQTGEGVVQIGDSKEDVGLDDSTSLEQLARIADRARQIYPLLENANVVRTWGALRVMTPDGLPIYQQSTQYPGAFLVTCHSGITLASAHTTALVRWLRGGDEPASIKTFKTDRFHV